MKKIFTIAALLCAGVAAHAQFVTPALSSETFEYEFDWAHAHNFVVISASEGVYAAMEEVEDHGIYADMRVDDVTNFLYVWNNTYEGADGSGENSFGEQADHTALKVTSVGWSGGGFNSGTVDWRFLSDDFILHFGYKTKNVAESHCFGLGGTKFAIGGEPYVDGGVTLTNLGAAEEANEWYYVDVPVSVLRQIAKEQLGFTDIFDHIDANTGAHLIPEAYTGNSFWFLSGATTGKEIHFDNVFLYTKEPVDVKAGGDDEPQPSGIYGDVNGDGVVNANDIAEVVKVIAGTNE